MSNQEPVKTTSTYPDMRRKPNKSVYGTANNRDKVVPRDPAKAHPASMKPKSKGV